MEDGNNKYLKIGLISLAGCTPFFLGIFTIFIAVFLVLGLFDSNGGSSGGNINNNISYQASCNFEDTKVIVMDASNTAVLATVSLEDYIIGVACGELGACRGAAHTLDEHYVKAHYIVSKTFVLYRGRYNSSTKTVTIKAYTGDQLWCDIDDGCVMSVGKYTNAYPGNYPEEKMEGTISEASRRWYTEEDLALLRKYYQDTYGDLFLPDSYNGPITTFSSDASIGYKSGTHKYWKEEAQKGKTYEEILESTATANVVDSNYYQGKSVYKLRDYCRANPMGSSGLIEADGEVFYNSGGLPIPVYYQDDYSDVIFVYANPSKGYNQTKTVASSGCGFASSSMIVSYLLDKKITPREFVDDWSRRYYVYNQGMSWALPQATVEHYGLDDIVKTTNVNEMVEALRDGHPVMSNQLKGLFTQGGHLIVLRGITTDNMILVNDPYKNNAINKEYNTRLFTIDEINRSNAMYFIWPKKQ